MAVIRLRLAALAALLAFPAHALDPGQASGRYAHEGVKIDLTHAIALSQDDAEGLLDHGPQVRVLLSDRDVPIEALYGIAFPPVRALARQGGVRGLLLEFNPADRTSMQVTVLDKPGDPTLLPPSISLSRSDGLWRSLTADSRHVAGDLQSADDEADMTFAFDAPVFTDPVAADLTGDAAQSSEQVRVLIARAQAFQRGDLPAAMALSSRQAAADLKSMPPEQLKMMKASVGEAIARYKAVRRVVVRQKTAVAIMGDHGWASLVLEDGAWKAEE
jgi:hypothetical protein